MNARLERAGVPPCHHREQRFAVQRIAELWAIVRSVERCESAATVVIRAVGVRQFGTVPWLAGAAL
jgi:hypothetical protein